MICTDKTGTLARNEMMAAGLRTAVMACNDSALHESAGIERLAAFPFDAAHRYMATLDRMPDGATRLHLKGAPEAVLALCSAQLAFEGGTRPLDPGFWEAETGRMATEGIRVIAVAHREADGDERPSPETLDGRLTLLDLAGLIDPSRAEAVAQCWPGSRSR